MQPYSNTSISNTTTICNEAGEGYSDLTDHDQSRHQVYGGRPMMTPLQPWMATTDSGSTPNEHQQSNYTQLYSNNNSFLSSSPSSSSSISTGCMPSVTSSSPYTPPLIGGLAPALSSLSSSGRQQQLQLQNRNNNNMVVDNYLISNNNNKHGDYQTQHINNAMSSIGHHPHQQEYSPSPSPPHHYRSNSVASDSSNPSSLQYQDYYEKELNTNRKNGDGKAPAKKREKALERNRQAALRCRQRKKEWLNQLQSNVEVLTKENRILEQQSLSLREEILNLKTVLLVHRDCSHAHITAGSISYDNLLYRSSITTAAKSTTDTATTSASITLATPSTSS